MLDEDVQLGLLSFEETFPKVVSYRISKEKLVECQRIRRPMDNDKYIVPLDRKYIRLNHDDGCNEGTIEERIILVNVFFDLHGWCQR